MNVHAVCRLLKRRLELIIFGTTVSEPTTFIKGTRIISPHFRFLHDSIGYFHGNH